MSWNYSNISVQTTLAAPVAPGDTSISIVDPSGQPVSFPFSLILDYQLATVEVVTVTNAVGATLTVTRGQDGTSAQSHSSGGPVVHGVVARDLAEAQAHIAATSNIHGTGVGGAVVGTNTSQVLTNKTISGASNTITNIADASILTLSATKITGSFTTITVTGASAFGATTITGTMSASGLATLSAGAAVSGGSVAVTRAAAGNAAYDAQVSGDTNPRGRMQADGTLLWGSGSATPDVNFFRTAASPTGFMTLNTELDIVLPVVGYDYLDGRVTGDTNERWAVNGGGKQRWGPGNAGADTVLYRSAAGVLGSDTIKANVSGSGETWHAVSGGIGFGTNWSDFGGSTQASRYRLMPDGTVLLSGAVHTTVNVTGASTIFTLPVGYRPGGQEIFSMGVVAAGSFLSVSASGVVALENFGTATVSILGLSGVRFAVSTLT